MSDVTTTYQLNFTGDQINNLLARINNLDTELNKYLLKNGGTMEGPINMNGQTLSGLNAPVENTQAATKGYTDTKASLPKTVSGTVISIDDASNGVLQGLRIYGKTAQDGTPTPEAPVDLKSVGDGGNVSVTVCGKNFIDLQHPIIEKRALSDNVTVTKTANSVIIFGVSSRAWSIVSYFYYLPAGTYTYSANMETDIGYMNLGLYVSDSIESGFTWKAQLKSSGYDTFTLDKPMYVEVRCHFTGHSGTNGETWTTRYYDIQIEKGSIATVFEPGNNHVLTLSTPNGLRGIPVTSGGNYTDDSGQQWICDEVDFNRGVYVQRIGAIDSYAGEAVSEPYISTTGALSSGAKVLYILGTPIETPIPSDELNAYAAIHTNKPNTTIYNNAGAHMDVGYYTPNATMLHADIAKAVATSIRKIAPRNLFDNSDFTNPVNRRGQTSYSSLGYTIDRWYTSGNTINIIDGAIEIIPEPTCKFRQYLEANFFPFGKTVTFTVNTSEGLVMNVVSIPDKESISSSTYYGSVEMFGYEFSIRFEFVDNVVTYGKFDIKAIENKAKTIRLYNAALYEGAYTTETLPEYQSKGYENELLICNQYDLYDNYIGISNFSLPVLDGAGAHNAFYRGKNIQNKYEDGSLWTSISSGTFEDLYIGDYFDITISTSFTASETVRCLIAGFDVYYKCGDTPLETHHAVIIPENCFTATAQMNSTDTTEGAYYNSTMHQNVLPVYSNAIKNVLGNHLLTNRERLTNFVSTSITSMAGNGFTGASNGYSWYDCTLRLMSEPEVYGTMIVSSSYFDVGLAKTQLPLFRFRPDQIICGLGPDGYRDDWWLSAVQDDSEFADIDNTGRARGNKASYSEGVRPRWLIG